MKRRIPVLMVIPVLLVLAWFAISLYVGLAGADTNIFVPGELIVKFKPGVSVKPSVSAVGIATTGYGSIDILNEQYGVTSLEKVFKTAKKPVVRELFDFSNIYMLKLPEDADILSAVEAYQRDPNVEYAEPNYLYHICVTPNDQDFGLQWALNQASDHDIDAPEAWDIETGDASIVIAIIDTGVDWDHPDVAANVWNNADEIVDGSDTDGNGYVDDIRGWDFVNGDNNPMDDHSHGTHCAGIAGAVTNNSVGIAGVSWNCTIMPVKGLNSAGEGSTTNLSNAITYAAGNGADVISMSWGSYSSSSTINNALNYAYDNGVVLVGAAGNEGISSKFYPAAYDRVIAVSATDSSDAEASFSNYGSWVDVAAPGVSIYSTIWNDTYGNKSGTSMSCPHVAGLVGLLLSKNSSLTQMEVRTILRSTTDSVTSGRYIGLGRINAYRAIQVDSTTIANLSSSLDGRAVVGTINITGTASGPSFKNYSVYYGQGVYPTSWTLINESTTQVTDGTLATWDTTLVDAGTYTVKLNVTDIYDNVSEDRAVLTVLAPVVHNLDTGVDYASIAIAVVNAQDGHTITVDSGTYIENIKVRRSLTIRSTSGNPADTIVQAANSNYHVFQVAADYVNISGFTVTGATGSDKAGIYLGEIDCFVRYCNISNNIVSNNYYGIYLYSVSGYNTRYNTLTNNTVNSNTCYGIYLKVSSNNTISDNTCNSNNYYGIYLRYSGDNTLTNNIVVNSNECGILLMSTGNNTLTGNIVNSNRDGLAVGSSNNTIYLNNFSDNTTANVASSGSNTWHSPTAIYYSYASMHKNYLGNYYGDYSGNDDNSDGIGDSPYDLPGSEPDDNYPLMQTSDHYSLQAWWLYSDNTMYRDDMTKPGGSITISGGGSDIWIADQAALMDITFSGGDTWTGQVTFTSAPVNGHTFTVEIGYSTNGSDFTAGGPNATLTGDGSKTAFTYTTSANAFIVSTGNYLALRITSNDAEYGVRTGGAWSYTSSPETSTDYSLPVELSSFTATTSGDNIILKWRTESEVGNVGFSIYRSDRMDGNYIKIAFVPGAGNSAMSNDYQFTDKEVEPRKTYFYYLEDIDIAGEKNKSGIIKVVVPPAQPIPKEFRLLQNFPNPFNPDTWLPYQLAADAPVSIHICNIQGQLVRRLNLGKQEAGYYVTKGKAAYWDGRNADGDQVASGIYWYILQAGEFNAIRRMVILK